MKNEQRNIQHKFTCKANMQKYFLQIQSMVHRWQAYLSLFKFRNNVKQRRILHQLRINNVGEKT